MRMMASGTKAGVLSLVAWSMACGGPVRGVAPATPPAPQVVTWTGAKPADSGAAVSRDLEASVLTSSMLGTGWNAMTSSGGSGCVDGSRQTNPASEVPLRRFAQPFSAEEAAALGPFAMTSQRFEFSQYVEPPEWQDPLARRLIYGVEWRTAREAFAPGSASLVVPPADARFRGWCGDAYFGQADLGGRLLIQLTLNFSTRAAYDDFSRLLGPAPAIWELGPVTSAHPELFAGKLDTSLSILMVGGDVTTTAAGLSADALMACGGGQVASCNDLLQQFVDKAMATGPGSTAESIAAQPARLGVRLATYADLGGPVARARPVEVTDALSRLDAAFIDQSKVGHRLRTLSLYWPASPIAFPGGLDGASLAVGRSRAALQWAVQRCFSISAPDDVAGIASCLDATTPATLGKLGYDPGLTLDAFPLP